MLKQVLYIDDDERNRALVRRILTANGFSVIEATNGLEGIDKAIDLTPDLVLMDLQMPGLDGFETTTRLKSMERLRDVPIIALSATGENDERERCLVAGCDGCISKPIDIDSFVKTVERFIGGEKERVDEVKEKALLRDYSQYLVRSLEDKVRQLEKINEDLERRVEKRTMALIKAQKKLVALEKKKTLLELAGGVAHELNQPLTVILSLSELLENNLESDSENSSLIFKIRQECNRASNIVEKIGNIESYKTKKYYKNIDILDIDKSSA